jgi:hypothetical protein
MKVSSLKNNLSLSYDYHRNQGPVKNIKGPAKTAGPLRVMVELMGIEPTTS